MFVDAAYLYAAGGLLCCGTKRRSDLELNFQNAIDDLRQICQDSSGLKPLRTYWYDAATNAQPTPAHHAVSAIAGVQLRLGRLTNGVQKGVDSKIVRDLIVLSRNRSMSEAFLLSGDDDLREGILEAQEMGVRVTLIGVASLRGYNQATTLVHAADATVTLEKHQVERFIALRVPPAIIAVVTVPVSPSAGP